MLRSRIIPCLLVHNEGLVKTVQFKDPKYVGDPINAVKIFNEKEVDELIVLDIDATAEEREPNYKMIADLAAECRMPFCYGGGVKTAEQAVRIINLGVEKVAVSSAFVEDIELVSKLAATVGSQSVVAVVDVKKGGLFGGYEVRTHNGHKKTKLDLVDYCRKLEEAGVGEIVINSIDHDGKMKGYDEKLISKVREATNVPMTVLGGAGSIDDIRALIDRHGIIGAGAGSLFVLKGVYRAVLINYPQRAEKDAIFNRAN